MMFASSRSVGLVHRMALPCRAQEALSQLTPDAVFEPSLDFADSVEKKLRIHRDSEVRRCDVFDVGWALMGDEGPPS